MAKFIEITTENNQKELINTEVIELIHVDEGKTVIRYSKKSASGFVTLIIKDSYDSIKKHLLR